MFPIIPLQSISAMKPHLFVPAALFCLTLGLPAIRLDGATPEKGKPRIAELPISVSSANYAETPVDELVRYANEREVLDPAKPVAGEIKVRRTYIFMPGEIYSAFPPYVELCRRLESALARAGFDNAADGLGRVPTNIKIDLVLRLSYGQREWRVPAVRVRNLEFREGMVTRPGINRIISGGADAAFDYYAGGNDEAVGAIANTGTGAFSSGPGNFAQSGSGGVGPETTIVAPSGDATALTETRNTRDYNLIVVDAFDYQELIEKRRAAKRIWSTFVAAPMLPGVQNFEDVVDRMIRTAQPYFGRTTRGIQFYPDARAEVILGPQQVMEMTPDRPRK